MATRNQSVPSWEDGLGNFNNNLIDMMPTFEVAICTMQKHPVWVYNRAQLKGAGPGRAQQRKKA